MQADGLAAVARVGINASHRGLLTNKKLFQLIKQWLGLSQKSHSNTAQVTAEYTSLNAI